MTTHPTDPELEAFATEEQFLLFCDVDEFTQIARAVLAKWGAPAQPAPTYKDSTPELHVGDSAFESWYSAYSPAHKGDKQRARDAYAAGMGDPLATAAPATVDSVTAPAGGMVVTDDMLLAALRAQYPAAYGQYLRHPANGPKTSLRTESEIATARRMIVAALSAAPIPPTHAADSVLEDADPLQGAANWLVKAHSGLETSTLAGKLSIGYNRAKRLHDAAIAARKQGANHD